MKQLITTLLFSVMSIFIFAQPALTEKMLNDHAQRLVSNPIKWMKEDVSPNFVLSGSEGMVFNYQQTMALFEGVNVLSRELADLKISQYGNVAVATGIVTAKNTIKANGMPSNYRERFTYVLQNLKNKWILMSGQHTSIQPPASEDNPIEVYKQWVQEYNKDNKAFLLDKCPEDLMGTVNGGAFYNNSGFKNMEEGQKASLEPSEMKSFQSGNLAVVMGIFTNLKKEADGTEKPSKEVFTAVMQKRNGKWLYVGHHATDMKQ